MVEMQVGNGVSVVVSVSECVVVGVAPPPSPIYLFILTLALSLALVPYLLSLISCSLSLVPCDAMAGRSGGHMLHASDPPKTLSFGQQLHASFRLSL